MAINPIAEPDETPGSNHHEGASAKAPGAPGAPAASPAETSSAVGGHTAPGPEPATAPVPAAPAATLDAAAHGTAPTAPASTPDATNRYDAFIDGFAHMMQAQRGTPIVAGRIFAYLLVCEPAEQTAAQIAQAIGASLGTISGMTRLLLSARLIEHIRRRGERSAFYRISPDAMNSITRATIEAVWMARQMTDRGLDLMADRPAEARTRLRQLRDIYLFFESSLPALYEQWQKERQEDNS